MVAAGSSTRMGGMDKLDQALLGRPLLRWAVEAMGRAESVARVILVARPDRIRELEAHDWLHDVEIVAGGEQRLESVRAGVHAATSPVVIVHDAARPLASPALADAIAHAAAEHGAAVPTLPVVDSLKREMAGVVQESVDRSGLSRAQTPQGARRELLVEALGATGGQSFTDEAALLESRGIRVATVPGEAANVKVTEPADLELVRAIATARHSSGADETRFGFGEDSHGFGPADGLWLGGVSFERAPRLHGHSDGDVVLHALSTAILSACGLGDLGRMFPDTDRATAGIASAVMLEEVVRRATDAGWRLSRAQVSVLGARPRLGTGLDMMRDRIAQLCRLPADAVALTASSGNLAGAEGAGRVVSARALISVTRER